MLLWLIFFALAVWVLRHVRAFDWPPSKRSLAFWVVAWIVTLTGLACWSYAAIVTYQIVMRSSSLERATMGAVAVHELTFELLTWVSPGVASHVAIWALRKRSEAK